MRYAPVSMLLVIAQFGLLAAMLVLARGARPNLLAVVLITAGVLLGLAALAVNRPGNFNVRPEPKPGAQFVTGGPYRWIRHPMYSALLVAAAGLVAAAPGMVIAIGWVLLALVLSAKAMREERGMQQVEPSYAAYMRTTRRFVPYLY